MSKVTIYTKDFCPYCVAAKALMKDRGVEYEEIKVKTDDQDENSDWKKLQKRSGMRTVPQIFHGDKLIGGFDSLSALDKTDNLESIKK
jgi:glutaredoxin 3